MWHLGPVLCASTPPSPYYCHVISIAWKFACREELFPAVCYILASVHLVARCLVSLALGDPGYVFSCCFVEACSDLDPSHKALPLKGSLMSPQCRRPGLYMVALGGQSRSKLWQ